MHLKKKQQAINLKNCLFNKKDKLFNFYIMQNLKFINLNKNFFKFENKKCFLKPGTLFFFIKFVIKIVYEYNFMAKKKS